MMFYAIFLGFLLLKRVLLSEPFNLSYLIPSNYDKLLPPKVNEDSAVNVTISLHVLQIRSVDETNMNFKMDIFIRQYWSDYRLNFPENMGSKKVVLDRIWRTALWTPDVWFSNALDTKLQQWEVPSVFYWLENERICFSARVNLELSCDMKMHRYPHDTQDCGVYIMALMNPSKDLLLEWRNPRPVRMNENLTLPQFDVGDVTIDRCDNYMYGELFSCVKATFRLVRRGGYFLINVYIPTVLIVAMSMLTFWIPPEAVPARITLGVTSLLTIITKQYQSSMPNVSYIVALNIWLSCCVAFVFCSLVEYGIVISLSMKDKNKVVPVSVNDGDKLHKDKTVRKSLKVAWKTKMAFLEKLSASTVDTTSRILFPCLFSVFCIIYSSKYSH